MQFAEIAKLVIGSILIIIAAYYTTYFIANRKPKGMAGRGIRVHERFSLSKDKMVCVIESQGKAYLVVITNGGATLLDKFDAEVFAPDAETEDGPSDGMTPPEGLGTIQRGLWMGFASLRNAVTARTGTHRRKSYLDDLDFDDYIESDDPDLDDDLVDDPDDGDTEERSPRVGFAAEEGNLDEMYRRLQSRRAAATDFASEMKRRQSDE